MTIVSMFSVTNEKENRQKVKKAFVLIESHGEKKLFIATTAMF